MTTRDDAGERAGTLGDGAAGGGVGGRRRRTADEIEEWLVAYLSRLLGTAPEKIATRISFSRYGLDSSASIAMASELSDWLGRELDPTINYSYPTIAALSKHLAE
ncbi:MAG TPA: acyl carrier protein [Vicinamibacteria bacterium]|nr:acyl carrier protein [Vicinamibacteria bacterium]